jgi:hypothetical protein
LHRYSGAFDLYSDAFNLDNDHFVRDERELDRYGRETFLYSRQSSRDGGQSSRDSGQFNRCAGVMLVAELHFERDNARSRRYRFGFPRHGVTFSGKRTIAKARATALTRPTHS